MGKANARLSCSFRSKPGRVLAADPKLGGVEIEMDVKDVLADEER